jgi:hypothetical protein
MKDRDMDKIKEIAEGCVSESADDYIGLWQISTRVRREFPLSSDDDVRRRSLEVARLTMERGLWPGDFFPSGFVFWDDTGIGRALARIDREWRAQEHDPTLAEPICWFDRRTSPRA